MLLVNSTSKFIKYTVLVISASEYLKRGLWFLWWLHLNSQKYDLYELLIWIPPCVVLMNYAPESTKCTALMNCASESINYTARTSSLRESIKYAVLMNYVVYESLMCTVFLKATSESIKARIHTFINWHFLLVSLHRLKYSKDIWHPFTTYVLFPDKIGAELFW